MKRKHIRKNNSGVCCCNNSPDPDPCVELDCCSESEEFPPLNLVLTGWSRISRSLSEDCCCVTEVWRPNTTSPITTCCENMGYYANKHLATRTDYGFKIPQGTIDYLTQCNVGTPSCSRPCCMPMPTKITETEFLWQSKFTYFFSGELYYDEIVVSYGRQLVQCDNEETQTCRYYIALTLYWSAESRIRATHEATQKRQIVYIHPCFESFSLDDPGTCGTTNIWPNIDVPKERSGCEITDFNPDACACNFGPKTCTTCPSPYSCGPITDVPANIRPGCEAVWNNDPTGCLSGADNGCYSYVKWFDEKPTGTVGVGPEDILTPTSSCPIPNCATSCPPSLVQDPPVFVLDSGLPDPPGWVTNPPAITRTVNNIVMDFSMCSGNGPCNSTPAGYTATAIDTCCEEPIRTVRTCPWSPCENPPTISLSEEMPSEYVEPPDDPDRCRIFSPYIYNLVGHTGYQNLSEYNCCFNYPSATPSFAAWLADLCASGQTYVFQPLCVRLKCESEEPCGDSDCCYTFYCGGCFCRCIPRYYLFAGMAENTLELEITGGISQVQCTHPAPGFTINLS
jgi:hypothetical protein